MKNLAIIPARSGSKGLKNKNIKLLNGKPLIWYSINAAIQSKCFDEIFVSTDSTRYANLAIKLGANVPFLRSKKLALDTSSSWDAVMEALDLYEGLGKKFDTFMLLQPTSPMRTDKDIVNAYNILKDKKANSVISVTEVEHSPLCCNILPSDGNMDEFFNKEYNDLPRQSLPKYYRLNGAIYLSKVSYFKEYGDIYNNSVFSYIMNKNVSIDIDDQLDFDIAELIIKTNNGKR